MKREDHMRETIAADPSRTIRIFNSHEEQELETQRYWQTQTFAAKMQAVAEMAEFYARLHGIDLDAQGPKRVTRSIQHAWR
jgi:hypothetical protein